MTPHTARSVFHVTTDEGKWVVRRERDHAGAFDAFETKDEAVERARSIAHEHMPSQVVVHHTDGTIETEFTYGNDPYPPAG